MVSIDRKSNSQSAASEELFRELCDRLQSDEFTAEQRDLINLYYRDHSFYLCDGNALQEAIDKILCHEIAKKVIDQGYEEYLEILHTQEMVNDRS